MLVNYFGATCGLFSLCVLLLVVGTGADEGECVCRGTFVSTVKKSDFEGFDLEEWERIIREKCSRPIKDECEPNCSCFCPIAGIDTTNLDANGFNIVVCTDGSDGEARCVGPTPTPPPTQTPPPTTPPPTQTPPPTTPPPTRAPCDSDDDCSGIDEICCPETSVCEVPVPDSDPQVCGDPHMTGLRGQKIDWSGVDGGWYCLVRDDDIDLQVNIRLTAPLADEFPDRQLITGLSILSEGHSLVVEVDDPYSVDTDGCLDGTLPCLSNGGLLVVTDGQESKHLLHPTRDEYIGGGMRVSASNLPVECRLFGGSTVWAQMYEMMQGHRKLRDGGSFEDWVMAFDHVAAPDWCVKYIKERGLADVQSAYALFRVSTPTAHVQLHVGIDHQGGGQLDWDGRALPDLDFWQMDAGVHGLSLDSETLTGILGETARPMLDEHGREIMEGYNAMRGTVEDYRVSGALGTEFALLHKNQAD